MISKVISTINEYKMIESGDKVFVAVSGGADSVCLLIVLKNIQSELGFELEAIHVEHGIRGSESEKDEQFVQNLCDSLGIKLHTYKVDAPKHAKDNGLSLEEAARELRYNCFDKHTGEGKVAIAHHMVDNAETMIFNMVRGSGIEGLRGIKKVRDNYIRPLINCSRQEIEEYLDENDQAFCVDSTNSEIDYTRNNIRHNIIPKLVEINSNAIEHFSNLSRLQDMAVDYIDKQSGKAYDKYVSGNRLSKELLKEELIIVQQVSHKFLCNMAGSAKDITSVHIDELVDLLKGNSGRKAHLPYNLIAVSNYDSIEIAKTDGANDKQNTEGKVYEEITLKKVGDKTKLDVNNTEITLELISNSKEVEKTPKTYTKMLDYDKITDVLCVRNRRDEDFLIFDNKGDKKKLNRYMIDEKIPSQYRDDVPLICDGSHVMYVLGHRISEYYKVSNDTRTVLKIEVKI